jgi:hypothetical protein
MKKEELRSPRKNWVRTQINCQRHGSAERPLFTEGHAGEHS